MSPAASALKSKSPKMTERAQLGVVISIALVCGLAASVATFRFLKDKERLIKTGAEHVAVATVVVARQDLEAGTVIGRLSLETASWPSESQPSKSFKDIDQVVGRQVLSKIFRGEPVVESRLLAQGEHGSLPYRIPDGLLGISVKVTPEIGVSGFIQPGNRVDVIATVKVQRGEPVTKLVLQNILVLAVGHEIDEKDKKPEDVATVTVAVSPEEAEKLTASLHEGHLVLALRSVRDKRVYETPGFSNSELVKIHRRSAQATAQAEAEGQDGDSASAGQQPAWQERLKQLKAKQKGGKNVAQTPPVDQSKVKVVELIEAGNVSEVKFNNP